MTTTSLMAKNKWMVIGLMVVGLAASPAMPMGSGPKKDGPRALSEAPIGGTVEGQVIGRAADGTLVLQTTEGKIVRLLVNAATTRERQFEIGDEVEAVMSPEGRATSIQLRKKALKR